MPDARKRARGTVAGLLAPVAALATLLYVAFSPLSAMSMYDRLIFDPDHDGEMNPRVIAGCSVQTLTIHAPDGKRLFCWYVYNPHAAKTVLLSHGNGGDLSDRTGLVAKLLQAGASVFAYDYEGFGLSEGVADVETACQDGLAVFDYLTGVRHIRSENIVLFGESLGTGVACQISSLRPSAGIILQSPFTSLMAIAQEKEPWIRVYPSLLFPRQRLDSLQVLAAKHPPLLIVHGAQDEMVPVEHGIKLYRCATAPKQMVILPDAHHEDMPTADPNLYNAKLRAFLSTS